MKNAPSGPLRVAGYDRVSMDIQDTSPELQSAAFEREALPRGTG